MTTLEQVKAFLALRRVALIGAAHQPAEFSRVVMRALLNGGFDVVPVNHADGEIEGRPVMPTVADVTPPVDWALVMTPATASEGVVRACAAAGVKRVWLHKGAGPGSVSDAAEKAAADLGLELISGQCPLMFLEKAGFVHRVHALGKKLAGTYPK